MNTLRISLGTLLIAACVGGLAVLESERSEAALGMPGDQQAYWTWVSMVKEDPDVALESGIDLVFRYPHLRLLYFRLPDVCRAADAVAVCSDVLERVQPPDPQLALYRDAARILLLDEEQAAEARAGWQYIARSTALDPALARRVVDAARADDPSWMEDVEAVWTERLAADSAAYGAAFGLGYAANLRSEWGTAEPLLKRVAAALPDDPESYRELGRIYYFTGQPEAFERALEAGIRAAEKRYDEEQGLILRGNLGLSLFQQGDLKRAGQLFEEALERSRALADEETEGFNLYRLAGVRFKEFRYDEALALLDSAEVRYAEHAPRQHPEVMALRGMLLSDLYRFSEAEAYLEETVAEAEAQRNVGVQIQAAVALTQLRYRMGRYAAAREVGLEALELAEQYRQVDAQIAARTALGDVERRWGSFEKAVLHYEQGLALARSSSNDARLTELQHRMGQTALRVGDANQAQQYYEKLLAHAHQHSNASDVARLYAGLGRVYSRFGNQEQAVAYLAEATEQLREAPDDRLQVFVLLEQAWVQIRDEAYAEAELLLREAQRLALRRNDRSAQYQVEVAFGNLRLWQDRYREALVHLEEALALEQELWRPSAQWHLLYDVALAHWKLGNLSEAEKSFREAIATIEAMRDNLNSRESRAAFVQNKVDVFKDFAAFLEEQARAEEAFYYTEQARSRSLADLLHTTRQGRAYQPDRIEDRVVEAKRRRNALSQAMDEDVLTSDAGVLADEAGLTRASHLRQEYLRADSIYNANISLLTGDRIETADPLPPDSVRVLLKPDEALIAYTLRDPQNDPDRVSAAYIVTPDTLIVQPLEIRRSDLEETVRFFRDQISNTGSGPGGGWQPASRRLYDQLVAPLLTALPASVRHLHLIPEGALHYLPFAALRDGQGRFLIERFTLSVAPSASILKICREHNPLLWRSILLVADPEGRLPGSRKEADAIASIPRLRPYKLVGEQATQQNLEVLAKDADIIHIATHGRFVSRAPWSSYLELHGGALSVDEIDQLPLDKAYLVTLSACETALSGGLISDVPAGDEWIGLNQAFLAAGTPTVMASLWPIDDQVSSRFMSGFYQKLLSARGKSHALAGMQRQFIRNSETAHPFYWAAFTVIGDPL